MTDFRALISRVADRLDHCSQLLSDDRRMEDPLAAEARAALAQSEPEGPTDEEIMDLMPQEMHADLAAAARAMTEQAGTDSTRVKGMHRIILNRHAVDLARAVMARWGRPAHQPVPVSERLPGPEPCWWFTPEGNEDYGWWVLEPDGMERHPQPTHWLPFNVLPLPTITTETTDD